MMIITLPVTPISPLRQRLIEDMNMRRFSRATQRNYIRDVGRFATFLRRPPDTATAQRHNHCNNVKIRATSFQNSCNTVRSSKS
jgi:hypothetical protein